MASLSHSLPSFQHYMTYKKGDLVVVKLGYKELLGVVVDTKEDSDKYITVKHDNFLGEVFDMSQVSLLLD